MTERQVIQKLVAMMQVGISISRNQAGYVIWKSAVGNRLPGTPYPTVEEAIIAYEAYCSTDEDEVLLDTLVDICSINIQDMMKARSA